MALSARDFRKILEIVDVIYSVQDNSAMFRAVCEELQKYIGLHDAAFSLADPNTGAFLINSCETFDTNYQGALILYVSHYAQQDSFVRSGWFFDKKHFNVSARNTDLVPENVLARSEFACEFLLPVANVFYSLAATMASQGVIVGRIGFHRQKREGNFSEQDKKFVDILVPHMAKAIHNRNMMGGLDPTNETVGVIAIGTDGLPYYLNDTAKRLLGKNPLSSIPDPGLCPDASFLRTKSGTYRVRTLPLTRHGKGKVVLLERYPPKHRLHPKFAELGLSMRESEIAALVVQGYSNGEIAERSFICEQTVKDHLHAIFGKLEVRSRGELTAKVLELRHGKVPGTEVNAI